MAFNIFHMHCDYHSHNSLSGISCKEYITESLDKALSQSNTKSVWSFLNKQLHRQQIIVLPDHTDAHQLACKFNDFFLEKPLRLRALLYDIASPQQQSASPSMPHEIVPLHTFNTASLLHIEHIIKNSPRKTSMHDPIPTWLLYKCLSNISPAIQSLVNAALRDGMPASFKTAIVTPALKKSDLDRNCLSNYRPVSNLPFLSKVIERVVCCQITNHLESNQLLDPQQSAYRKHHSCESALTAVLDAAFTACDEKKVLLLVMLDLSAAFDTVDHLILSSRLIDCGITGEVHSWLISYLSHRQQLVQVNDVRSEAKSIQCGVPQGSVLGPLLFLVYMNGIRDVISKFSIQYMVYADDIQLFVPSTIEDLHISISRMEECIKAVKLWLASSMLSLNDSKTEIIILGSPNNIKKCAAQSNIIINDVTISPNVIIRDLGVWLDSSLNFKTHVNKVCAKSYAHLRLVNRVRRLVPPHLHAMLLHSLVLSHVNYCPTVLFGATDLVLNKLQAVLNATLRAATGLKKSDHISTEMKDHKWLSIKQRITHRVASLVFNTLKTKRPSYLYTLLEHREPVMNLRSNNQLLLKCPFVNSAMGARAFRHYAPVLWNSLPLELRKINSLWNFNERLKSYLLTSDH
jgi:hypothetical protein